MKTGPTHILISHGMVQINIEIKYFISISTYNNSTWFGPGKVHNIYMYVIVMFPWKLITTNMFWLISIKNNISEGGYVVSKCKRTIS